jgi:DNA-binding GntR family transcriptional regulator
MTVAAQRAYKFIRSRILSGALPSGARLLETSLAQQAGLSRTPVREAIRKLEAEGLVTQRPHFGAVVRGWSLEELEDIFSLRAVLESHIAERAAARAAKGQVAALCDMAEKMLELAKAAKPGYRDRISKLNADFHQKLIEAAGSERVRLMMSQVFDLPLSLRTFLRYDEAALMRSVHHHLEIAGAVRNGDAPLAGLVMRTHILAAWRAIEDDIKRQLEAAPGA